MEAPSSVSWKDRSTMISHAFIAQVVKWETEV